MARQAGTAAVARSSSTATWSPMLASAGLMVVVVTLLQQPAGVLGAAPSTDEDCAGLVSVEEVARGKGAFLSGCSTLSESYLGGCWTQEVAGDFVEESTGCQTCIIQETAFSGAVFPVVFPEELDPCPDSLDYTAFYEDLYGASLSVVTAASLTSTGCPEGWLYSEDTGNCYLKSPNTAKAENQAHASTICEAEDAWLIAINSEAENDFLLHNLLFSGFFGETYTGMTKDSPSAEWVWPAESSSTAYDCLGDFSNWIEGPEIGCDSDFGDGADGSCMEIFPYEPKGWNPFSCAVGKHYVCEKPSTETGTGTTPATTPGPTPASVAATPTPTPSTTPVSAPTPAPAAAAPTSQPSTSATVEPTVKAETAAPTAEATRTSAPEAAATVEPTMAGAPVGVGVTPGPAAAAGPAATATTAPTALPSGADDDPSEDDGDQDRDLAPTPSSASPPPSASPPSPVPSSTSAPTLPRSWAGSNLVSLTLAGVWTDATYSLYLKEGDSQTAVATDLTKDALGTSTHTYYVKDGCYGLEVASTGDPTELTWTVAGGQAFQNGGVTTGQGLDGCRFTVGGGVCDARECQAQCLSDLFATADGDAEMSATSNCDGYAALISGACGDVCPGDDGTGLDVQQNCVRAGCDAEMVCGLDFEEGGDGLDLTFQVEIKALLEAPVATTTSGAVSGSEGWDPDTEFGTAVASWLRVEPEDVVVTAVDGVGVEETSAEGADSQTQEDGDDQGMGYRQRRLDPSSRPAEPIQRRALQTDSSAPSSSSSSSSSTGTSGTGATKFTRYRARIYPTNSSWEEASGLEGTADAAESGGELEDWLREGGGSWAGAWVTSVEGEVVEELSVVSGTSEYATDSQSSSEGSSDDALLIGGITAAAVVLLGLALMAFCRARKKSASRKSVTRDFLGGAEQGYASPGSSSSRPSHQRRQSGGIRTGGGEKFQRLNDDEESFPYGGGKDSSASAVGPGGRNSGGVGGGNGAQTHGGPAVKGAAARVFVPVDLGQEDAVSEGAGGPPSAAAAATSSGQSKPASTKASIPAASVAHKRRQQQRQQEHGRQQQQQQQRSLGGAGFSADELSASEDGSGSSSGSGSGGGSSGGRSANAAGGVRRNGPRPGRLDSQCSEAASTAFPSVYGVGAQGSAKTAAVEEDEAVSDQDQFGATPTSSIAASSTGTLHHKRASSKIAFVANGTEVKDTETLNTKQPTIRGPSGALASLGFARGRSLDSFDEGSAGGYGSADGGGNGSLYDGGSEAGSRYHGQGGSGPVMGSGGRTEGGSMQLYPTAEARILEMKDRQKNAKPVTRLTSFDMTLPSPGPCSPSTDWDLAQGIAPSPGGEGFHDIRSRGSSRRRGARMSSQSSVDMADRQFSRVASKNGRSSSSPSSKQSAGGEGSGVGGGGDALSVSGRSSRPPISRSGSRIGTPGRRGATGGARSGGRRGGGGGGEDNSGGGHASSREGGRGGGSVPIGRGVSGGRGAGDSDCAGFIGDTVDAGGRGAERQQQQGRQEGARKAGGGDPQNPHDDSDGESMFYGRSSSASGSAEGMLLPAARKAGASRASDGAKGMLPPPSPLAY